MVLVHTRANLRLILTLQSAHTLTLYEADESNTIKQNLVAILLQESLLTLKDLCVARGSHMLGKHSTTELHPQLSKIHLIIEQFYEHTTQSA